jgi:hypothetical protein
MRRDRLRIRCDAVLTRHPVGLSIGIANAIISGHAGAALAEKTEVHKATVCDLLMHPDALDAKTISIQATFVGGLL